MLYIQRQWALGFLVLTLLASVMGAQQPPEEVTIVLSVTDKYGRVYPRIKKEDLEVRQDGTVRPITRLESAAEVPIVMEVLVDASGSMVRNQQVVAAMAKQFLGLNIKEGRDTVAVMSFGGTSMLEQGPTDDLAQLRAGIDRAAAGSETKTALYAALVDAANRLSAAPGRRVVLITTDGDSNSGKVSRAKAIEALQRSSVSVVALFAYNDFREMRKLVQDTGGQIYAPAVPRDIADIDSELRQISRQIASQYLLTFQSTPPKKPGSLRDIQIRAVRNDVKDARFAYRQRF